MAKKSIKYFYRSRFTFNSSKKRIRKRDRIRNFFKCRITTLITNTKGLNKSIRGAFSHKLKLRRYRKIKSLVIRKKNGIVLQQGNPLWFFLIEIIKNGKEIYPVVMNFYFKYKGIIGIITLITLPLNFYDPIYSYVLKPYMFNIFTHLYNTNPFIAWDIRVMLMEDILDITGKNPRSISFNPSDILDTFQRTAHEKYLIQTDRLDIYSQLLLVLLDPSNPTPLSNRTGFLASFLGAWARINPEGLKEILVTLVSLLKAGAIPGVVKTMLLVLLKNMAHSSPLIEKFIKFLEDFDENNHFGE